MDYNHINPKQEAKIMKKTIDYTALADTIRAELNARHDRSAWDKAVTLYALDLLDDVQEGANNMERLPIDGAELEQWALNGASCWEQYSNGGCLEASFKTLEMLEIKLCAYAFT